MNKLQTKLAALLVTVLCAALVAPSLAGAQQVSPTAREYRSTLDVINAGGGGNDPSPPESAPNSGLGGNVGPLPFTGFDVIAMAAVALAVTGLGLALQRAVSREPSDELS